MEIDIIGVPLDFGSGRRGVDMGPSAIRYAGLQDGLAAIGHTVRDRGNIEVPIFETCSIGDPKLCYLDCIIPVARRLMGQAARSIQAGRFPLTLGGDHSLSIGSVRGASRHRRLGLIWIDAHGDFNTHETTPSGNLHGMPLAGLAGLGDTRWVGLNGKAQPTIDPANIALIGVRDLDPGEKELLKQAGVSVFSILKIDQVGLYQVMQQAIEIASTNTDGIYLSFDMDSLNPIYAPGVGTPVQGGLTYREAHMACEMIAETGILASMDLVEVNTILDERNKTAQLAMELACSALGQRVW